MSEVSVESKLPAKSYGLDTDFGYVVCMHCELDLEVMTLRQILTHPWVNENNCVKYYLNPTWTNKAVRSYGLDTNFCYVCTVT